MKVWPLLVLLFLFSCNKSEDEIIIVPSKFKGYILVIFNQKHGESAKYENNRRIYKIPKNGILKTQFSTNDGIGNFPMFFYGKISATNQIPYVVSLNNVLSNKLISYGPISGSAEGINTKEHVAFVEYFVGTKAEIEKFKKDVDTINILKISE